MDKKDYKVKLPDWFKQDETSDSGVLEVYVSPIKISMGRVMMDVENGIVKAVQETGFDVDKEELTKALQYDRGQYDKGFADGVKYAVKKMAERLKPKLQEWLNDNGDLNGKIDFGVAMIELIGVKSLDGEVIAESLIDEIAKEITEGKDDESKDNKT